MRKEQLESALQEAARIAALKEIVLVGSQAVFAHTDAPPIEVLVSEECDILAKDGSERLSVIESPLGKGSAYHRNTGVFVDPVQPELILLPQGWQSRLKPLRLQGLTVWALDMRDLIVSKLNAGRLKDYEFINAMLRTGLAKFDDVVEVIRAFPDPHQQAVLLARLRICAEAMP